MTKADFVQNNRGIDDGHDIAKSFLEQVRMHSSSASISAVISDIVDLRQDYSASVHNGARQHHCRGRHLRVRDVVGRHVACETDQFSGALLG